MYYNGQIVYDLDAKRPVRVGDDSDAAFAWTSHGRTTHFIRSNPKREETFFPRMGVDFYNINGKAFFRKDYKFEQNYEIALPQSVEEAQLLLDRCIIMPAPCPATHHWRCRNWLKNHEAGACTCTPEQRAEDAREQAGMGEQHPRQDTGGEG